MSSEVVLPPFLANVALLITAPSLGCLNTYVKTLTDLCMVYNVPMPDFKHILQYKPTLSSMIPLTMPDTYQNDSSPGTSETKNELKNEYTLHDVDIVKHEQLDIPGADTVEFRCHTCVSDIVYCDGALIWKISRYCWMILVAHGGVLC